VCCVESSNFHVTVVPTETVRVMGVNMKFLISTVDPPLGAAEPLDADGVADTGGVAPLLPEPEPQAVATARTASKARRPNSRRRGLSEDLCEVPARFISASFSGRRRTRLPDRLRQANPPGHRAYTTLDIAKILRGTARTRLPESSSDATGRGEHPPSRPRTEIPVIALPIHHRRRRPEPRAIHPSARTEPSTENQRPIARSARQQERPPTRSGRSAAARTPISDVLADYSWLWEDERLTIPIQPEYYAVAK